MKTKRNVLITVLAVAVSACVAPPHLPDPECHDRTVTLNHRAASLDAHPEYVEICAGNLLTIKIVPPVGVGEAKTKDDPSNPVAAPWITKDNALPNRIVIPVPVGTTSATYKYSITIEGVGTLDPRARVK